MAIREDLLDIMNIVASFGAGVKVKRAKNGSFEYATKPNLPEKEATECLAKIREKYPKMKVNYANGVVTVTEQKKNIRALVRNEIKKLCEDRFGPRGSAILPMKYVDLKTGANSIIDNIYTTWENDFHFEIWKDDNGKFKVIFGYGDEADHDPGDAEYFYHDQTSRPLGRWILIGSGPLDKLKGITKYGSKLPGYVYK